MYDTNNDGKLSGEELDKCPGLKAAAARLDPEGKGVTAAMIAARINAWQKMKIGRMTAVFIVFHNGKPLAGANVKLVPEAFFNGAMQTATGKTAPTGLVGPSIPTSGKRYDPSGVPPGFYRIEITKPGLDIPAKYNTATILGVEVAADAPSAQGAIRLDLEILRRESDKPLNKGGWGRGYGRRFGPRGSRE